MAQDSSEAAGGRAKEKVLVIGLSKTGTSSLKQMLTELGYRVCGPRKALLREVRKGNLAALDPVLDEFDAFEDWPWPLAYRHAHARYGARARFILSTRITAEKWFRSIENHGYGTSPFKSMRDSYGRYRPFGREAEFTRIYEGHNAAVRDYFAGNPGQFIELCLERGDGWEKLCGFLGRPVPDAAVPHRNRTRPEATSLDHIANRLIAPVYRLLP